MNFLFFILFLINSYVFSMDSFQSFINKTTQNNIKPLFSDSILLDKFFYNDKQLNIEQKQKLVQYLGNNHVRYISKHHDEDETLLKLLRYFSDDKHQFAVLSFNKLNIKKDFHKNDFYQFIQKKINKGEVI